MSNQSTDLDEILDELGEAYHNNYPDNKALNKAKAAIKAYVNERVVAARIDELERLPNTKPVWFDPKLHTNYVDDRIKQLKEETEDWHYPETH